MQWRRRDDRFFLDASFAGFDDVAWDRAMATVRLDVEATGSTSADVPRTPLLRATLVFASVVLLALVTFRPGTPLQGSGGDEDLPALSALAQRASSLPGDPDLPADATELTRLASEVALPGSLRGAVLRGIDLRHEDLRGRDLTEADLSHAVLAGSDLSHTVLTGADLSGADLTGADLTGANLTSATLKYAEMAGANVTGAVFAGADLRGVDLSAVVDLEYADLGGAAVETVGDDPNASGLDEVLAPVGGAGPDSSGNEELR